VILRQELQFVDPEQINLVLGFHSDLRDKGDGEMTNETMKALVMIAMFGTLEIALYFHRIRETTVLLWKGATSFLMQIAAAEVALVPVRVRRKTR